MSQRATTERGRFAAFGAWRNRVRDRPTLNLVYRTGVGVLGTAIVVLGLVLVPYPGPGWLIVIGGLAVLASEFGWARRVLRVVKHYVNAWTAWLGDQSRVVQALFALLTTAIVLVTLWLLGTFALVGGWFGWDAAWLESPVFG